MSKETQRKQSAFSAGRQEVRDIINYMSRFNYQKKTIIEKIKEGKNIFNPFYKENGLRQVWNAGYAAELKKLEE